MRRPGPATVGDVVAQLAADDPTRPAIVYLSDGETPASELDYGSFDARARGIAAQLREAGLTGQRALLSYADPVEFVLALFGCFYAGVVAVPVGAGASQYRGRRERVSAIARDCAPAAWLVDARDPADVTNPPADADPGQPEIQRLRTDTIGECDGGQWQPLTGLADQLAIVQYTSGTTSDPRGVMVSHANVLANVAGMAERGGHPHGETAVTWLPLYHDMGLFGGILHTLYTGGRCVLMPPMAFLRRPIRWLRAISHYRGFVSGGPDFAYLHAVRRTTEVEREGLDLSCWRVAFNGAEPVRADTIEQFSRAFAGAGFQRRAFTPLYGLAETTLMATGPALDTEPAVYELAADQVAAGQLVPAAAGGRVTRLVGCGYPVVGTEARIVDPDTREPVPDGGIGEIWLRGDSVAKGYWNRPEDTAALFAATLASGEGPYLRTGDLGGVLADQLVVTGRRKDLIIVRGVNHYPQDIEDSARRAIRSLRPGAGAAFTVDAGDRGLVVLVQELPARAKPESAAVCEQILAEVAAEHAITIDRLVLVRPGQIPLTSSGKVQRHRCRDLLLDGELRVSYDHANPATAGDAAGPVEPDEPISPKLATTISSLLGRPAGSLRSSDPLTALGLDSLAAAELQERVRQRYGVEVDFVHLLSGATVGELAALVRDRAPAPARPPESVAPPAESGDPFPLTELQQAYLVGRGEGIPLGGVGTHSYLEFRHHRLDLPRLLTSWRRLVSRHPMLRAVITPDGQQQIVAAEAVPAIGVDDLREVAQPMERLRQTRQRMERQVHDPCTPPVYEVRVSLLPGDEARIHLSFDLLLLDAPSILQILREWGESYAAPQPDLPPPAGPSFREYQLARQRRAAAAAVARRAALRERAADLPPGPALPLATDPATVGVPTFHRRRADLDSETLRRLRAAAGEHRVTVSALLGAAYAETLAAFSEERRFSLNVTSFARPAGEVGRQVVGEFTSLLLVPVDPPAGEPFAQRVRRFAEALLGELRRGDLDGVALVRERARMSPGSQPPPPYAPVVFTSLQEDAQVVDWLGELAYGISQTPQVWLDHQLFVHRGGLVLVWDAVDDLFPDGLLDEMFSRYQRLLRALAERSDWSSLGRELMGLPGLREQLPPATVTEPAGTLDRLVHAQARRTPNAGAVYATGRVLSYQDLSAAARRLAGALTGAGVGRQGLVAVVLEKGWQQAPAVLGVLTAGAAYLPIDPEVPPARLAGLLRESRTGYAVTNRALAGRLAWPEGVRLITVDELWAGDLSAAAPPLPPVGDRAAGDLAYVIYTSGSTGAPKGVAIEHGGALNTIADINHRFGVGAGDRVLGVTPLTFDLSVYDLFGPLSCGGALVVPEQQRRAQPDHWVELIRQQRVTVWNSVPALLRMLWDDPAAADRGWAAALRLVLLSGDWISVPFAAALRRELPGTRLVSLGGATEAAIWSVLYEVDKVDESWVSVPYGRAMRGQGAVVLDQCRAPRPAWVPGPLYLAGAGLARGYLHDPERTRASFVTGGSPPVRLYRTGDLARLRSDGELELLGREDDQLKVQGHRIEPGEVEEALTRHPAVREAVVGAVGPRDGSRRLVAYIRAAPASPAIVDEVRAHAGRLLPPHAVPDTIRAVTAFPLTSNGKVDRRALFAGPAAPAAAQPAAQPAAEPGADAVAAPAGSASAGSAPAPVVTEGSGPAAARPDPATQQRVLQVVSSFADAAPAPLASPLSPATRLTDLELTSMELIQLGGALEREFGHRPDLATLYRLSTLADLAGYYAADPAPGAGRGVGLVPDPQPAGRISVLTDPAQREEFKRGRRVRALAAGEVAVELPDLAPHPAVAARRSAVEFGTGRLHVSAIAGWLACLREHVIAGEPRRAWGSAGALYPVDIYLQVAEQRVAGLASGFYQYDPRAHRLLLRSCDVLVRAEHHWPENRRRQATAAGTVFLVGDLAGIEPAYGELAEQFCYLEAGAIGQLLATSAPGAGLAVCPIGSVDFGPAQAALGLAMPRPHLLLHTMLAGAPAAPADAPQVSAAPADAAQVSAAPVVPAPRAPGSVPAARRVTELLGDTQMRLPVPPPGRPRLAPPEAVLVTGATGFLGRQIVAELLDRTPAVVHGLATATGAEHARARIMTALAEAGVRLDAGRRERIVGVPGDLAAPWLGLPVTEHQRLADRIDLVIHAGAGVNWLLEYDDLKPVNVTGTRRLLELTATGGPARLVHISTVAVFPFDRTGPVAEDEPLDHGGILLGGYPQSKWVAEKLVAGAAGLDTVVIRPGTVAGHSRSGVFNPKAFFESFLRAVLETGWAPISSGRAEVMLDLTPVDHVAAATVALALHQPAAGPYHLVNPAPMRLSRLYELLEESGYPLHREPYQTWRQRVLAPATVGRTALAPFASYLAAADERFLRMPPYDCANTWRDLARTGVTCPPADERLLHRYLEAGRRTSFFPAPKAGARHA